MVGPRSVVVAQVLGSKDFAEYEPRVCAPLSATAVDDGLSSGIENSVQSDELVIGAEGAVVVGGLGPWHIHCGGDVFSLQGCLLEQVGGGH